MKKTSIEVPFHFDLFAGEGTPCKLNKGFTVGRQSCHRCPNFEGIKISVQYYNIAADGVVICSQKYRRIT